MEIPEQQKEISEGFVPTKVENYAENDESDTDDSQEDPTFDILEETRSGFSKLSIKKKSRSRIPKEMDEGMEGEADVIEIEMTLPEFDEKDQKSYEIIQKIIDVGQVEKLKVEECKVYLRKHGLRLTGNKDILIERIKEHLDVVNGGGETKYPASSFVLNCKGDACTGDVVMFEQNVYEMFNIASRSASGPPCGTRVVAGRIVKESYGAAKQQHTFTIEVLWSKGEKPLPPLHPLLIKGRNLYKSRTMRQRWEDEGKRQKILWEKHTRGSVARSNREARIQEKEMRKVLRANRASRMEDPGRKQEELGSKRQVQQDIQKTHQEQNFQQKTLREQNCQQNGFWSSKIWEENTSVLPEASFRRPNYFPSADVPLERIYQRQPLTSRNCNQCRRHGYEQNINSNPSKSPFRRQVHEETMNFISSRNPLRSQAQEEMMNNTSARSLFLRRDHGQKQLCRYFAQGRCYYGDQCKYLHEYR